MLAYKTVRRNPTISNKCNPDMKEEKDHNTKMTNFQALHVGSNANQRAVSYELII